ncbi:hypothetical protein Tsubulata_015137 [Turnera subulata]|uniref:Shikimate kinase n=1 Tax=Turnera subulata TaxID=218843 RepID=A0A9Q0F383_9ROSI|nr:hypothetical protein Tsubulata_015137 [Turnera subulata]
MVITTATPSRLLLHFPAQSSHLLPSTSKCKPRFHGVSNFDSSSFWSTTTSRPRALSTTCSLSDGITTKVAEVDCSLELKKKAADIVPILRGTSIFLVGTKSSVKSNVGKVLADALRYYYFDSDSVIEEAAGGELAAESLRENDEEGYMKSVTEVLKELSSMGRLVVSAGDGAVQNSTNLGLLRHGISLWIDVPLDMVAKEMTGNQSQPPESHSEVLNQLLISYEELKGRYGTADARITLQNVAGQLGHDALDSITMEELALQVLTEIEKLTRVKKMMEEAGQPF